MKKPVAKKAPAAKVPAAALTYAQTGGPPKNWPALKVFDGTGAEIIDWIEVDTENGFCRRYQRANDKLVVVGGHLVEERVTGSFTIKAP